MRPSFRTTTLIAAIGMIVFTLYVIAMYLIRRLTDWHYHYDLTQDIIGRICMDSILVSLIVACAALSAFRPIQNATKRFRMFTYALTLLMLGTIIGTPFSSYTVMVVGHLQFWPPFLWRIIMMILGCIWLCMLACQEASEQTPRAFRIALFCGIAVMSLPILLEIASGISLLSNGHILWLNSAGLKSWIRYFVPTILLCWYSIAMLLCGKVSAFMPHGISNKTLCIIGWIMIALSIIIPIALGLAIKYDTPSWGGVILFFAIVATPLIAGIFVLIASVRLHRYNAILEEQ